MYSLVRFCVTYLILVLRFPACARFRRFSWVLHVVVPRWGSEILISSSLYLSYPVAHCYRECERSLLSHSVVDFRRRVGRFWREEWQGMRALLVYIVKLCIV
ncbi:hypothetical protein BKA63DRAFT_48829 [Paraphoma chrysanthemicola]|nr:hypothetical protein BKA63DRAFT_48829 [Paraphoma chrysanthemicola]